MELSLNVSPEAINQMVSTAVLESAIGAALAEAVQKQLKDITTIWNNPIDPIIRKEILLTIQRVVQNDFKSIIEETVKVHVTKNLTDEAMKALLDKVWNEYLYK